MNWHRIIGNRDRAACALLLTCALVPAAMATQSASGTSTSSTKKSAAKATSPTHHPTAKKKAASSTHKSSHASAAKSSITKSSTTKSGTTKSSAAHTASARSYSSRKGKKVVAKKPRGQQKIDSERAEEIQSALIREHYLTGDASGTWNQASEDAMRHYQADHGWQTKEVPDSRALIKLGLGPSKDHLLNPESAMTTSADAPKSASLPTTSQAPSPVSSSPGTSPSAPGNSSQPQR